jgi:hypothetical protein
MKKIIGKIKNGGGDKGVDVNLPKMTNSGSTLVSVAPGFVSGSYTNKKGNTFSADYDKFNKSFSIGAKINLRKKNK